VVTNKGFAMSETPSPETPRRLLNDLCQSVADRADVERKIVVTLAERKDAAETEYQAHRRQLDERYRAEKSVAEADDLRLRDETTAKFEAEHTAIEKEYETVRNDILAKIAADQQAADQALQDRHWEAMEAADADRGGLNLPLKDVIEALESRWHELEDIHNQAVAIMQRRGHWSDVPAAQPTSILLEKHPGRRFCHALEQAQVQLRDLAKQFLPKLFQGARPAGIFLLIWIFTAFPSVAILGWDGWHWIAASAGAAATARFRSGPA
jgi:hypothetical protein